MKVLEHVLNTIIREQVSIDSMQFGFISGRGNTAAIFILRQLQIGIKTSTLHLLILRSILIVYHVLFFSGQCSNLE